MESIDKIKRLADIVSKNTAPGSNTNTLIGNLLKAMALYMDVIGYDVDGVSERFDLIRRNFDLIRIDTSNSMNELASIGDKVKGVSLNKGESNKKYLVITDKNGNVLTNECLDNSLSITNEENRAKLSMLDSNGNVLSFVYLPTSSGSGESGTELSVSDITNAAINQGWI